MQLSDQVRQDVRSVSLPNSARGLSTSRLTSSPCASPRYRSLPLLPSPAFRKQYNENVPEEAGVFSFPAFAPDGAYHRAGHISVRDDDTPHAAWFRMAARRYNNQMSSYEHSNQEAPSVWETHPFDTQMTAKVSGVGTGSLHVRDETYCQTVSASSHRGGDASDRYVFRCPTLQEIAVSTPFQIAVTCCLLLNAVIVGLQTDYPDAACWQCFEEWLLVLYILELSMRIWVAGVLRYFRWSDNADFGWNLFDFLVVGISVMYWLAQHIIDEPSMARSASHMVIFRMVRLLRVLRVLRIIRIVRFLKQLYLLAYGFIEGSVAVFWVALLVSLVLYMCALVLVRTYGHVESDTEDERQVFGEHFSNIPESMFTLFELIVAPNLAAYRKVMFENPLVCVFFVVFVILGSFGVNGIVVALINENILEKNEARKEAERLDREYKRTVLKNMARELFDQLDENKNRVVERSWLLKHKPYIIELFGHAHANFQIIDLEMMMYVVDAHDTGIIEREDFVRGVLELCDGIRPMSIMELNYQVCRCANKMEACARKAQDLSKSMEPAEAKVDDMRLAVKRLTSPPRPAVATWLPRLVERLRRCQDGPPVEETCCDGDAAAKARCGDAARTARTFRSSTVTSIQSEPPRMPTLTGMASALKMWRRRRGQSSTDLKVSRKPTRAPVLCSAGGTGSARPRSMGCDGSRSPEALREALEVHGQLLADTQGHVSALLHSWSPEGDVLECSDDALALAPVLLRLQRANADLVQRVFGDGVSNEDWPAPRCSARR